jgi:hypothetical protein
MEMTSRPTRHTSSFLIGSCDVWRKYILKTRQTKQYWSNEYFLINDVTLFVSEISHTRYMNSGPPFNQDTIKLIIVLQRQNRPTGKTCFMWVLWCSQFTKISDEIQRRLLEFLFMTQEAQAQYLRWLFTVNVCSR